MNKFLEKVTDSNIFVPKSDQTSQKHNEIPPLIFREKITNVDDILYEVSENNFEKLIRDEFKYFNPPNINFGEVGMTFLGILGYLGSNELEYFDYKIPKETIQTLVTIIIIIYVVNIFKKIIHWINVRQTTAKNLDEAVNGVKLRLRRQVRSKKLSLTDVIIYKPIIAYLKMKQSFKKAYKKMKST